MPDCAQSNMRVVVPTAIAVDDATHARDAQERPEMHRKTRLVRARSDDTERRERRHARRRAEMHRKTRLQLAVYYQIADGSETTATFSWGTMRQAAGAVLRFSNVDTNDPIGAVRPARGSSDEPTAPTITTTQDGSRVLRIVVSDLDEAGPFLTGSVALTSAPRSSRVNVVSFPDAATDPTNGCGPPLSNCDAIGRAVALGVSDARQSTVKPTGAASWGLAGGDQWIVASIEIKQPPPQ